MDLDFCSVCGLVHGKFSVLMALANRSEGIVLLANRKRIFDLTWSKCQGQNVGLHLSLENKF